MRASEAKAGGSKPLARSAGHSGFAHEPEWFTTAPVFAIKALHEKLGWTRDHVDLYEINEAFACVTMAAMNDVGLDTPRSTSMAARAHSATPLAQQARRIIVTLLHALRNRGLERGVASLCIGGGEAVAIGIEVRTKEVHGS